MQHPSKPRQKSGQSRRLRFVLLPAAAAVALALAGCGGGGGGSGGVPGTSSFSGAAIDAPMAGATVTITSGAPLTDGGTTIGTITANAQGGFTISVSLPSGSVPIFANAADPQATSSGASLELTSYLGQSDMLAAVGALSTTNLPDLDISPVTTAALAVYAQTHGGSYSGLTPAGYAVTLASYRNDILAIAAAVKAVGDGYCTPSVTVSSTVDLAGLIASNATLSAGNSASTTLAAAAAELGGTCSQLPMLQTAILADPRFGPELDFGDVLDANVQSVVPGNYELQAVIAETPVDVAINTGTGTGSATPTPNPAEVLVDTAVNVDASGNVTSSDHAVSGTLVGNLLKLDVQDASHNTYQFRAKIGSLPTSLSTQQAYSIQGGGINTGSGLLTEFNAALAPAGAVPAWNAYTPPSHTEGVAGCPTGDFPLRFDLGALSASNRSDDSLGSLAMCVAPTSTSWSMTAPTVLSGVSFDDGRGDSFQLPNATLQQGGNSTITWSEATGAQAAPFILEAPSLTLTLSPTPFSLSGTGYYVMGSRSLILGSTGGSALLNIQGDFMSQLSESSRNPLGGDQSSHSGDH